MGDDMLYFAGERSLDCRVDVVGFEKYIQTLTVEQGGIPPHVIPTRIGQRTGFLRAIQLRADFEAR